MYKRRGKEVFFKCQLGFFLGMKVFMNCEAFIFYFFDNNRNYILPSIEILYNLAYATIFPQTERESHTIVTYSILV
jgi:hypothetical protein